MAEEGLRIRISADLKALEAGLAKATSSIKNFGSKISSLGQTLSLSISAPLIAASASIVSTVAKIDSLQKSIAFSSGSAEEAAKNLDFLKKASDGLGLSYEALLDGFKGVNSGLRAAGFTADQTRDIFGKLSKGFAGAGLNAEDTKLAFNALTQIQSKGVVSMEELRQQLGERLPGAMNIAAEAMGMTVEQLNKLVAEGKIAAKDFIPAFATGLEKTLGPAAESASKGLTAAITRMQNSFLQLQLTLGVYIVPIATRLMDLFRRMVSNFANLDGPTKNMAFAFAAIAAAMGPVLFIGGKLIQMFGFLTGAVQTFVESVRGLPEAFMKLAKGMQTFASALSGIATRILAPIAAIYLMSVAVRSLYKSFEGVQEIVDQVMKNIEREILMLISKFVLLADAVKKIAEELGLEKVAQAASKSIDYIGEKLNDLAENEDIQKFAQNAKQTVIDDFTAIAGAFESLFSKLSKGFNIPIDLDFDLDKFQIGMQDMFQNFNKNVQTSINQARSSIKDYSTSLQDLLAKLKQITWEQNTFGDETAGVREKIEVLKDQLRSLYAMGMQNTPMFQNVLNELKVLEAELVRLQYLEKVKSIVNSAAEQIGSSLGELASGAKTASQALGAVLKNIINALIDTAVAAVAAGTAAQKGFLGFAALPLAIAAGAAAKTALSALIPFANGGIVSSPTAALVGEYPGAKSDPEVISPLSKLKSLLGDMNGGGNEMIEIVGTTRIEGEDLITILKRANRNQNYKYGTV